MIEAQLPTETNFRYVAAEISPPWIRRLIVPNWVRERRPVPVKINGVNPQWQSIVNDQISESLKRKGVVVFAYDSALHILDGSINLYLPLNLNQAVNIKTPQTVNGIQGDISAEFAVGPHICFYNISVGDYSQGIPFPSGRLTQETPELYRVSFQNNDGVIKGQTLFGRNRRGTGLVTARKLR